MKYNLKILILVCASSILYAQNLKPASISVSYFAESLTHPGIKIAADYELASWQKSKTWNTGKSKNNRSSITVSPTAGFFYHKDYQTGLMLIPELAYTRKKSNGNFISYGLGAGYMRTFVPNVYDSNSEGEFVKTHQGYNYFLTNYFVAFGKDLSIRREIPLDIFVKPQFMCAVPGTAGGVWYFAAELGVRYRL